jgi:hypothetical protein
MVNVKQDKRIPRNPPLKRKQPSKVSQGLGLAATLTLVAVLLFNLVDSRTYEAKQRVRLQQTFEQLQKARQELDQTKDKNADTQKQLEDINKQLEDTKKQLQSKKDSDKVYALEPSQPAQPAQVSGNTAKANIYAHESGNRTDAINASSGACGLGQALPCSKLPCTLHDYACQDAWFTNYAIQRYGSWENAWAFWQIHHWW